VGVDVAVGAGVAVAGAAGAGATGAGAAGARVGGRMVGVAAGKVGVGNGAGAGRQEVSIHSNATRRLKTLFGII
jgi:hypothetical protein